MKRAETFSALRDDAAAYVFILSNLLLCEK